MSEERVKNIFFNILRQFNAKRKRKKLYVKVKVGNDQEMVHLERNSHS